MSQEQAAEFFPQEPLTEAVDGFLGGTGVAIGVAITPGPDGVPAWDGTYFTVSRCGSHLDIEAKTVPEVPNRNTWQVTWTPGEIAPQISSVAAELQGPTPSGAQRVRVTTTRELSSTEAGVLAQFVGTWQRLDVDGMGELIHEVVQTPEGAQIMLRSEARRHRLGRSWRHSS